MLKLTFPHHAPTRLLIPFLLVLSLLAGCDALPSAPTVSAPATPPVSPTARPFDASNLPVAPVTFRVTIPANTPPDQAILLSLLDEVTGLAINPKRFAMTEEADFSYVAVVELPVGSVVQYRYSRQAGVTAEEHTADGRPVRYRLLKVDGPVEVHDVVTRWNDTTYDLPSGQIAGKVTDTATGQPVPNLLIAAGGLQTLTAWDGTFRLEGLPVGTHNLAAFALDGRYHTFQQGAVVAEHAVTEAIFSVTPAELVDVTFRLTVPPDTIPAVPVRIAGNLYQFGNTFANLSGGFSVPAARMPVMAYQPDGSYLLKMQLPVGAFLRYKYTLGDGFWNAERTLSGDMPLREMQVPPGGVVVEDVVATWYSTEVAPIWFEVTVPADMPEGDVVSLQLNPWGWTQPLPMWKLEANRWVYLLSSPLDVLGQVTYRYCRNDQCGSADDVATGGRAAAGRPLTLGQEFFTVREAVEAWAWAPVGAGSAPPLEWEGAPRGDGFVAGVEFLPGYHPTWLSRFEAAFVHLKQMGVQDVVLSPTWTYSRVQPLVFEVAPGEDMPWLDVERAVLLARGQGLRVTLFPAPLFDTVPDLWWEAAPRDAGWWASWFERYRAFALHHAGLAQLTGAERLVLGGEWLGPALPNGYLTEGAPSNVLSDAEARWREILAEVRAVYSGELAWALPFPYGIQNPPVFLGEVDTVYLLWSVPLADGPDSTREELKRAAEGLLDGLVSPFEAVYGKPVVIAVGYPAADGGLAGCVPREGGGCLSFGELARADADLARVTVDLEEQWLAYAVMLEAVNERGWVDGFVSRGFYPPAALADASLSVHGKPAEALLSFWFLEWGR